MLVFTRLDTLKVFTAFLGAVFLSGLIGCGDSSSPPGSTNVATGPLRVGDRGAAQFREARADNSLEEYGHEAAKAELKQAAANLHAYLAAWFTKDWPTACTLGSGKLRRILKGVSELSTKTKGLGCIKMIAMVASGEPPLADTLYKATDIDAESLRVAGNAGYILYYLQGRGFQQEMARENRVWRVKTLLPASLH